RNMAGDAVRRDAGVIKGCAQEAHRRFMAGFASRRRRDVGCALGKA
ncbi:MAG: hypothetical protein RLZZ366_1802, partial [Pseudomonadota bacterium]